MRRFAVLPLVFAWVALQTVAGCSPPTSPKNEVVHRTVSFLVTDSQGVPAENVNVSLVWRGDSGLDDLVLLTTGPGGWCATTLRQGSGLVLAHGGPSLVAGSEVLVPGASRPASDTILVRLRLGAPSGVSGRVTLKTQTNHSDTSVSLVGVVDLSFSDANGTYVLGGVPPGHWTLAFAHQGYAPRTVAVDIVQPGSSLTLPAIELAVMTREP